MNSLRSKLTRREQVHGVWCSLASPVCAEIVAGTGYDWMLLDLEHAPGSPVTLLHQLQAASAFPVAPLVRVPVLERSWCAWALDLGAAGLMFPNVENAEQARCAVAQMRYPPEGTRGVGAAARAGNYGRNFAQYAAECRERLVAVAQIESAQALEHCREIAAVDGVDVLFAGPADLGANLGLPERFASRHFLDALRRIADAALASGKAAGILLPSPELAPMLRDMGYTFIGAGSDSALLARSLTENLRALRA